MAAAAAVLLIIGVPPLTTSALAQSANAETDPEHHRMIAQMMRHMTQVMTHMAAQMSQMTDQMSEQPPSPKQKQRMAQRMEVMSKVMQWMSIELTRPAMGGVDSRTQMEEMRKQMDEIMRDPAMNPDSGP